MFEKVKILLKFESPEIEPFSLLHNQASSGKEADTLPGIMEKV